MVNLIIVSPFIFGILTIVLWAALERGKRISRTTVFILGLAIFAMTIYAAGYIGSLIGDASYEGSGEQFDWGPHYLYTLPMSLAGMLLAPTSTLLALILGLINRRQYH